MSPASRLATGSSEPHPTEPPKRSWLSCPTGPRSRTSSTMRGLRRSPWPPRPQHAHSTNFALDVAGSGVLPELVELAGAPEHVITVADFPGAQQTGVRFSRGDTGRATYALAQVARMAEAGRFSIKIGQTF